MKHLMFVQLDLFNFITEISMKVSYKYILILLTIIISSSCSKEDNKPPVIVPLFEIGELAHGGIVFYIDETGEHGLVSALEDAIVGASDTNLYEGYHGYEWGCYEKYVPGAGDEIIGSGYQNTIDILTHMCESENGGLIAAQAALDYESEGYSDWYLPSSGELEEMHNTIGFGGEEGNIGNFLFDAQYWSSTESESNYSLHHRTAYSIRTNGSYIYAEAKDGVFRVRAIRSF